MAAIPIISRDCGHFLSIFAVKLRYFNNLSQFILTVNSFMERPFTLASVTIDSSVLIYQQIETTDYSLPIFSSFITRCK